MVEAEAIGHASSMDGISCTQATAVPSATLPGTSFYSPTEVFSELASALDTIRNRILR